MESKLPKVLQDIIDKKLVLVEANWEQNLGKEINTIVCLPLINTGNKDFDNGFNIAMNECKRRLSKVYYNVEIEREKGFDIYFEKIDKLEIIH